VLDWVSEVMRLLIQQYGGRVVVSPGDSLLGEFAKGRHIRLNIYMSISSVRGKKRKPMDSSERWPMSETISFNDIYVEYQPKILHYLSRLMGDQEAEDTFQEVFEKVNRGLEGFRGQSKLSTWIYRIATNAALDRLGSSSFKHRSEHTALVDNAEVQDRNPWTGQPKIATDQELIRKQMSECVREFIDRLPPDYKPIIILSELEGFKDKEVADILQISLETVKIRLHRARASLRKVLNDGCSFYRNDLGILVCDRKPTFVKLDNSD
jgi:RNA polymerase sigma-70 factor (ECF subfamily)